MNADSNHCYAVKTYRRRNAQNSYEKELEAFRRITEAGSKSAPGIIEFYGSFEYRGSFNTVLEYAEAGTLERFWKEHDRPSTGSDGIAYWESLFEIVRGVWWLHDHRLPLDNSDTTVSEQGCAMTVIFLSFSNNEQVAPRSQAR
jgi:serine/threonine protein kinase